MSSDEGRGGLSYRIPLDALPAEAQIRYLEQIGRAERSERGCTESFDLEAYKAHYGAAGVEKLLERQKAVLRLRGLRQALEEDLTGAVNALAAEYGMSGATLRRLEGRYIELYRRNLSIPMDGVTAAEVGDMLSGYSVSPTAREELTRIATDVRHGGLGNFVEILNICLNIAQGGEVTQSILKNAMKYKLMPR